MDVEPALCVAVTADEEHEKCVKSVRFDMAECADNTSSRPGQHGKEFAPGPAYSRKCEAARVAARQRAIDLVGVVDLFEENFGRLLRTDASILTDDRRVQILRIPTLAGLKFDCFTAEYDDYCPVLAVDYRCTRDALLFHHGLNHRDRAYEHHWLFLALMTAESAEPAAAAVETGTFASPTMARADLGNDVFVAYDRRAREDTESLPRAAPVTLCGPVWILEAASCLTSKAPVNGKIDRWLVDIGCGYDIVSREHTASMKRWVQKAGRPRSFQTANGITTTDKEARVTVNELSEEVAPYILGSTPAVLSVGYRCMNLGYSLYWPKLESPYFLLPFGKVCPLVTKGDVPYLYPGTTQRKPKDSKMTRCFA